MNNAYNLNLLMKEVYKKKHLDYKKIVGKKASRFIKTPFFFDLEVFLSGSKRYKYEHYYLKLPSFHPDKCSLCFSEEAIVYKNRLIISADHNPFFCYHMLLRPCKKNFSKEHLKDICSDIKYGMIKSSNLSCREEFLKEDIEAMGDLAFDMKDHYVTQSMKGSGASIPQHVHAHIFPKNQTRFPLLDKDCFTSFVKDKIWVNKKINYSLLYKGSPKEIAKFFCFLKDEFSFSANHIIYVDEGFDSLVGVYVPRKKEIPYLPKFSKVKWKFGVFEVLGLFDAKSFEIYRELDYEQANLAIKEVTIQDRNIQKKIEDACIRFFDKI